MLEAGKGMLKKIEKLPPTVRNCFYSILNEVENYEGASIDKLSAWMYNEKDGDDSKDLDDQDFLPKGGYGNFISKAASGLKIKLNTKKKK